MKKIGDIIFVIVFAICISLPFLLSDKTGGVISLEENRYLAEAPMLFVNRRINWRNGELSKDIDSWIGDNAFGRRYARDILSKMHISLFHDLQEGQFLFSNDWRFLWLDDLPSRAMHTDLLEKEKIDELKTKLTKISNWVQRCDHYFCATIFPHKLDVCGMFLPDSINIMNEKTRTEQLGEIFSKETGFSVTSCYPELKNSMEDYVNGSGPLTYYKAYDGSHWNWRGAFIGYEKLMNTIKQGLPDLMILSEKDFNISTINITTDLSGEIAIEEDTTWTRKTQRDSIRDDSIIERFEIPFQDPWNANRSYINKKQPNYPKALIVGDSYLWMYFLDDIAESFSEMVYINIEDANVLDQLVECFQPDVVAYAGIGLPTFIEAVIIPDR